MKTKTFLLLLATTIIIVSCAPKPTVNKDMALADSLLKVNVNAYNSGDAQIIANMFTDDALLIGNGKYTWTKDSILSWARTVAPSIKNFKGTMGPVTVTNDMVFMNKYWTLDFVVQGKTLPAKGLSILIWKKQSDNSWKTVLEKSEYDFKTF